MVRQGLWVVYGGLDEGLEVGEWWKVGWKVAARVGFLNE